MAPSVGPPQPGGNGLGMLTFTGDETVSGAAPAGGAAHNATTASAAAAKRVLCMSPPLEPGWPPCPGSAPALAAKLFPPGRPAEPRCRRIDYAKIQRIGPRGCSWA